MSTDGPRFPDPNAMPPQPLPPPRARRWWPWAIGGFALLVVLIAVPVIVVSTRGVECDDGSAAVADREARLCFPIPEGWAREDADDRSAISFGSDTRWRSERRYGYTLAAPRVPNDLSDDGPATNLESLAVSVMRWWAWERVAQGDVVEEEYAGLSSNDVTVDDRSGWSVSGRLAGKDERPTVYLRVTVVSFGGVEDASALLSFATYEHDDLREHVDVMHEKLRVYLG